MLELCSPTMMRLSGYESRLSQIRSHLTYTDSQADWTYRGFQKAQRW